MTTLILNNVSNLQDTTTAQTTINNNNQAIITAVNNCLAKDGSDDLLLGSIDANSNRILNLPQPLTALEPLRLTDLNNFVGGGTITNIPAGGLMNQALVKTTNADYQVSWGSVATFPATSTSNLMLMSVASAEPAWSNNTWPFSTAQGDLLYGSATNVLSALPKNTTSTRYLANTGSSNSPNWDQVNLTNGATGTLQAAQFPALSGDVTSAGASLSTTIANSAVTNAKMANMNSWTIKGNATNSSSAPADFTIDGLTLKGSPAASDEIIIWDVSGTTIKKATVSSIGSSSGVASIGGQTGTIGVTNGIDMSGSNIELTAARRTLPTSQVFTSGSGTYTTPANVLWIEVKMVGGGGGSSGSGSGVGSGGNGANTTFGTMTAGGGGGGSGGSGGTGGTATGGDVNLAGNLGADSMTGASINVGGSGGCSIFGGFGAMGNTGTPHAATANTGSGGGGAGIGGSSNFSGSGGGSGAYVYKIINTPAATYSYIVGTGGGAGSAGSGGGNGAAGGSGIIMVTEHYGT